MHLVSQQIRGLKTGWLQNSMTAELSANAPVMFFLHGFPDSPYNWRYQLEAFSNENVVVAPFLRGVGASEAPQSSSRFSKDAINLDLLDILRCVDPKATRPVYVVGHDIGSLYAWNFARLLGSRLKGLIIVNGVASEQMASRFSDPNQVARSWYIAAFQIPKISEIVFEKIGTELVAKQRAKEGLGYEPIDKKTLHSFLKHYRAAARGVVSSILKRTQIIAAPTLVIAGKDDPYLVTPTAAEVEKLAMQSTIRVIEGGHWIHEQHPERINQKIMEFMREHR